MSRNEGTPQPLQSLLEASLSNSNFETVVIGPTPEPPPAVTLFAALVEAQRHAGRVYKRSVNEFHRYRYASAEAMIEEGREALLHADLGLIATGWTRTTADGEMRITVSYLLFHASGETREFSASTPVIVEKSRPLDKAEATALTYNLGYFLRGLLLLPRVEEGTQPDARDDRPAPVAAVAPRGPALARPAPSPDVDLAGYARRMEEAPDLPALNAIGVEIAHAVPPTQRTQLHEIYRRRLAALSAQVGAA